MAESPSGEKTEQATPRRRGKALEEGQVAMSQEVNSFIVLFLAFSLLFVAAGFMARMLNQNARYLFSQAHTFLIESPSTLVEIASANVGVIFKTLAPLLIIVFAGGFLANVLQVGLHVNVSALAFRWSKLNPISGLKQIVSRKAAFEMLKNILKIIIVAVAAWLTVRDLTAEIAGTALLSLDGVTEVGEHSMKTLVFRLLAMLILLAAMDWTFQKWQHDENLKMTKKEVKEEHKDIEGDPQIKARIRAIQMEAARRRMMVDVPTADVVVTNPTHFAVALKYVQGDPAPKVVAKGKDHVAQKIKEIARQSRVPVLENKPLARALHKAVKVGAFIPDELYKAVAEVLAYIYRLKRA